MFAIMVFSVAFFLFMLISGGIVWAFKYVAFKYVLGNKITYKAAVFSPVSVFFGIIGVVLFWVALVFISV